MDTQFPARPGLGKFWSARQFKHLACVSVLLACFAFQASAQTNLQLSPLVITTEAGLANFGAADGIGPVAKFFYPASVALDAWDNVYVADPYNDTIRKVTPSGIVTTLAGLAQTFGTNDGLGTSARFSLPFGITVDPSGNVYVADTLNSTIRKITTNGAVTTFAGVSGLAAYQDGYVTNGGTNMATFAYPYGITVDNSNNIYVADTYANLIRKITYEPFITNWFVSTLAGDNNTNDLANSDNFGSNDGTGAGARFNHPYALAADHAGNVYVADTSNNLVRKITSAGVVTTIAGTNNNGKFSSPSGIAVDAATNIYVADTDDQIIQVLVTTNGTNWTVSPSSPLAGQTNVYGDGDGVHGSAGATLNSPWGVAVDGLTNVYVGDSFNGNIREITAAGSVPSSVLSTLAGPDGSYGLPVQTTNALQARFHQPNGVALDSAGNAYVADTLNNCIQQLTPAGTVSIVAGSTNGTSGSADGTNTTALFYYPTGLCLDSATNIYVADYSNSTVRLIVPMSSGGPTNWVTTTYAGLATNFGLEDGVGTNARFDGPFAVAVDSATNLYVTDNGNALVRIITPGQSVSTYAGTNAEFVSPVGIAVDSSINLYVTDDELDAVYIVPTNGVVSQFDTNDTGLLNFPEGVAVDASTNVYVANSGSNSILGFNAAGDFQMTLAGTQGFVGSADGLASTAQFDSPVGLAVAASGNVYVADSFNNTIRTGTPFNPGQMAVLTLDTSPPGLPVSANGSNYPATPAVLALPLGGQVSVAAMTSITNVDLATLSTNYYAFSNWTTNGGGVNPSDSYSFTLNGNETLTANYTPLYTFTVSASPANGGTASGGETNVPAGTLVNAVATSLNNYRFTNWTFNNTQVSTNPNFTFALEGNYALVANFLLPAFTLMVTNSPNNGGTSIASFGGVSGTNLTVTLGSLVTVTATAAANPVPGYAFSNWSTSNGSLSSINPSYSFTITTNEVLVANFSPYYNFSVTSLPVSGGTVIASCGSTNSTNLTVLSNSLITVTATPTINPSPGYAFVDWITNGAGPGATNANASYTLTLQSNETLTANFSPYYDLTVTNSPSYGGSVLASNNATGAVSSSNLAVVSNNLVTLFATATNSPSPGYAFIDWSTNGGGAVTNTNAVYTFPVLSNETVVGHFSPYYVLNLINAPTNAGTSTISSGGVTNSTSLTLLSNSTVTATATPASSSWALHEWATTNYTELNGPVNYTFQLQSNETIIAFFYATFALDLFAAPTNGGTISGGGRYTSNSIVSATATANNGYTFSNWVGTSGSTNDPFRFTIYTNFFLTANFVTNPPYMGVFDGTNVITNGETSPLNFGTAQLNQSLPAITFTVTNTGGQPLLISNILVPPDGYTLVTNPPANITNFTYSIPGVTNSPLTNQSFTVKFVATNVGANTGNITILNNANNSTNGSFSFAVTAMVLPPEPEMEVFYGTTNIANGQLAPVEFGGVMAGQPGPTVTFTVTNLGDLALVLTNLTAPPGYTLITNPPPPTTIPIQTSAAFTLQLDTGALGTITRQMTITNNDPTNNPFSFVLSGVVTSEAPATITLIASPANGGTVGGVGITNGSGIFSQGSTNTVTATSGNGYTFVNWTVNGVVASTLDNYTFTLATNVTLVANFLPLYSLTAIALPANTGSVQVLGGTNGSGLFPVGSVQQVLAVTNSDFKFIGWTSNGTGTNNPLTVLMDANLVIVANFATNATNITLTVTTNGEGTVTPNENGKLLKPGNTYSLTATPVKGSGAVFSNWTGTITTNQNPLKLTKIQSSMALQANFVPNPFPPFVGTYNGLFWATDGVVSETNAGMLKGLSVTSKGTYSGSLLLGGATHALSGTFNLGLQSSNTLGKAGVAGGTLVVLMTLTPNDPAPLVTGSISNANWVSTNLTADRATNNNEIELAYTMLIPPDTNVSSAPTGYGYATIAATQGSGKTSATAKISGVLADGTAFSQSVPVSVDSYVPVYASIYSSKGLLLGWLNLTNASGDTLSWIHPLITTGSGLFKAEFASTNQILLSPWTNPPDGSALPTNVVILETNENLSITTNEYPLVLSDGKLESVKSNAVTLLSGTFTPKTGLLKLTFGKTTGTGVILLNATNGTNGGGYFLTKTNSGPIIFQGPPGQ